MTEPTAAVDTEATEADAFRAQVLAVWAAKANQQGWNGEFSQTMRQLGYSDDELAAARDAGKDTHTITLVIRTTRTLDTMYGGLEGRIEIEARRLLGLNRDDSVKVEHVHTHAA